VSLFYQTVILEKKYTVVSKQKLCVHNNIYFATNTEHTGLNKSWQLCISQLITVPYIQNLLTSSISLTTLTDLGRPGLLCRLSSTVPDSSNVVTILCTDFLLSFPRNSAPGKLRHLWCYDVNFFPYFMFVWKVYILP
jgi:hypothetical protein